MAFKEFEFKGKTIGVLVHPHRYCLELEDEGIEMEYWSDDGETRIEREEENGREGQVLRILDKNQDQARVLFYRKRNGNSIDEGKEKGWINDKELERLINQITEKENFDSLSKTLMDFRQTEELNQYVEKNQGKNNRRNIPREEKRKEGFKYMFLQQDQELPAKLVELEEKLEATEFLEIKKSLEQAFRDQIEVQTIDDKNNLKKYLEKTRFAKACGLDAEEAAQKIKDYKTLLRKEYNKKLRKIDSALEDI